MCVIYLPLIWQVLCSSICMLICITRLLLRGNLLVTPDAIVGIQIPTFPFEQEHSKVAPISLNKLFCVRHNFKKIRFKLFLVPTKMKLVSGLTPRTFCDNWIGDGIFNVPLFVLITQVALDTGTQKLDLIVTRISRFSKCQWSSCVCSQDVEHFAAVKLSAGFW